MLAVLWTVSCTMEWSSCRAWATVARSRFIIIILYFIYYKTIVNKLIRIAMLLITMGSVTDQQSLDPIWIRVLLLQTLLAFL